MQAGFLDGERNLDKQLGVILEIAVVQAGDRDHRPVGSVMQAAELIFSGFKP